MRHIVLLWAIYISFTCAYSQNTTRKGLKLQPKADTELTITDSTRVTAKSVRISGYEKAQNSAVESMFITNNGDRQIEKVNISIIYLDRQGRQLHRRDETISSIIPPGQTNSVNLKAWDRQRLWYYVHTQAKHNDYCTPFDVKIRVNFVVYSL